MSLIIAAITLFAMFMVEDAEAVRDDERLAEMFSPILILTKETDTKYDAAEPIRVIKPEPVSIVGAESAANIWISGRDMTINKEIVSSGPPSTYTSPTTGRLSLEFFEHPSANCPNVDFSANMFAFLTTRCSRTFHGPAPDGLDVPNPPEEPAYVGSLQDLYLHFNYPGNVASEWNEAYFDADGDYFGEDFPNTAYVHIYERTIDDYRGTYDPITVIQYKYFYPYDDWWNNHEGDWQGIDVVVSSRDPETAEFLGVEYRFHGVWLSYYKDYSSEPGITDSFVFNAIEDVRLAAGTHPVAYIGAGSHAAYPIGGDINLFSEAV